MLCLLSCRFVCFGLITGPQEWYEWCVCCPIEVCFWADNWSTVVVLRGVPMGERAKPGKGRP